MDKHLIGKTSRFLAVTIAALAVAALAAAGAQAASYTAKIGKLGGDEETAENLALLRYEQIVERRTKGDVDLQIFIGNQLGDEVAVAEGMRLGSVEGGLLTSAAMSTWVPQGDVWALPFIFRDADHAYAATTGKPAEILKRYYTDQGFHVAGLWTAGARHPVGHYAIEKVEDAKGKKIRVKQSQLALDIWKAVDANPTPMPWPEVANAIETKTIDLFTTLGSAWWGMKLYETAPHFSEIGHTWVVYVLAFSDRWWKKLPPEYQKIMEDSAAEMGIFQHNYLDYANVRGPQMAAKLGYQVHQVTDKEPWVKAMSNIWGDWAGKVNGGQELIDAVRAVK
jgi:TRAP-type C4-dicarboxylate transport system substrate-binding protein